MTHVSREPFFRLTALRILAGLVPKILVIWQVGVTKVELDLLLDLLLNVGFGLAHGFNVQAKKWALWPSSVAFFVLC